MSNAKIAQAVITLHDVARTIEQEIGAGKLSENIRKSADRLHDIALKEFYSPANGVKSELGYSRVGADAFKRGR
jgi:hypothetical protein